MSVVLVTLFGRPGSGKTTLGDQLEQLHGFVHLALGRMLRDSALLAEIGIDPAEMRRAVDAGRTITNSRLYPWINALLTEHRPVVVDGYPRTEHALSPFAELAAALPLKRRIVALHLVTTSDITADRVKLRARDDDSPARLLDRNEEYERVQRPLLGRLPRRVELVELDAGAPPDQILAMAERELGLRQPLVRPSGDPGI